MSNENAAVGDVRRKGGLGQRIAYACGNLGQSAFYNAMSTYFVVYVTSCLFSGVDKALAAKLIGVITSLVVIIRIAEIFIDPLLGNIVDNTTTKWGRFRPWQFIGGAVSAVLLAIVFSGMFGLVNVNTTLFIVLFVITFVVLDVFYSLRDISYWGMIPALSSDSHERSTYTSLGSFTGSIGYNGITIVVITHEMAVVKEICHRVAVIESGVIKEMGRVVDIFTNPQSQTMKDFVTSIINMELPAGIKNLGVTDQPSPDRYMLVRLRFKGAATSDPVVADIVRKFNVEVSVLYGNIDYIQDEPFGYLIVVIMGDMETQAKAFSYIKTLPIGSEVLGYVPRNH